MEQKKKLIDLVLKLFLEQGVAFKMDDVAAGLKISKKTIYKEYGNKEALIILVVEAIFEGIEHQLKIIMDDTETDVVEKIIQASMAHPDVKEVDYHTAILLKDDFPGAYSKFIHYIEDNWDNQQKLFEEGVAQGLLKPIDFLVFKTIILGITKEVLETDANGQDELMESCVRTVIDGFRK